jgi:hypothetical protein
MNQFLMKYIFILNQITNDEPNNEVAQTLTVDDPNSRSKSYTDYDIDKIS